ncbi:kinase-like protein [Fomitiporia mediterranea MF3/22]|uniref:kinase-like protein n=1 Tax=Fomitiporia mediterranea (strain MF3/22) TaxID=694068 RepID=UPI00044098D5|nr:kinase-like protein [Fomitiporia mediterranea MF3/22]EJD02625.1 kinase-like protein [Fomitiporia mediterranea MF3/22]
MHTYYNLDPLDLYSTNAPALHPKWSLPIQQLTVGDKIGGGTFSEVWSLIRADIQNEEGVAVSFVAKVAKRPRIMITSEDERKDYEIVERARTEARLMRELSHPHILKCYGAFINIESVIIICEMAEKGDLSARQYTEGETKDYVRQLLKASHYMHSRNALHGDLKPENLLIRVRRRQAAASSRIIENDVLVAGDFGSAAKLDGTEEKKIRGTLGYIAPEQFKGQCTTKSDMWSVGYEQRRI